MIHARGKMMMQTTKNVLEIALITSVMDSILHKGIRADNVCVCMDVKKIRKVRKIR
jgi:hypothetical protein